MLKKLLLSDYFCVLCIILIVAVTSCGTPENKTVSEGEQREEDSDSPKDIAVINGDADALILDAQLKFLKVIEKLSPNDMALVRQIYQFGEYNNIVYQGEGPWADVYAILHDSQTLAQLNAQDKYNVPYHTAISKVLQAYAFLILVDHYGDVPFSEALNPEQFEKPGLDSGVSVYKAQISALDEAIKLLEMSATEMPNDLYFQEGFNKANWIALANTIKLRAHLNMRLVNPAISTVKINMLLNKDLIDTQAEDFQFRYGTAITGANAKHPAYNLNYGTAGASDFMSNNYFDLLNAGDDQPPFVEKGNVDPRLRYYTYRQIDTRPTGANLPCEGDPRYNYCYVGNFYRGRDHNDSDAMPNDQDIRTTYGVYPIGGAFDRELFVPTKESEETMLGAGIFPIYLSSFTNFALAEASLTLGTSGSPQAYLEAGIRASMNKVATFNKGQAVDGYGITPVSITNYVNRILKEYNNAYDDEKLEIIQRELHLASFGNGLEDYNSYRRTGMPILQSPVIDAGTFPRVWYYPSSVVDLNPNISQHPLTNQTFWDANPAGFID